MSKKEFNLHLGDNANYIFEGTTYCGMNAVIPVILKSTPIPSSPQIVINTSEIETLADWQAHSVHLDNFLIGYLKDTSGQKNERHEFDIPKSKFDDSRRLLSIRVVGKGPSLEDDFVLRSIESHGFDMSFGWA